jgi:hypothetical protein
MFKLNINKIGRKELMLLFGLFTIIFFFVLSSCKKQATNQKDLTSEQIMLELSKDSNFKDYVKALSEITNTNLANSNTSDFLISEFESEFKKAAFENNQESRANISTFIGFNDTDRFWILRNQLNASFSKLLKSYNLKKINMEQWKTIISDQRLQNFQSAIRDNIIKVKVASLNPDDCYEQYTDCLDDALAVYATEQVVCVGAGALGWTGVGIALFVSCESASYYHLTTSKRKCTSTYKTCK